MPENADAEGEENGLFQDCPAARPANRLDRRRSHSVSFSKDGRTILVGSMIDHRLDGFGWEDGKLTPGAKLDLGSGPAAIRTAWPQRARLYHFACAARHVSAS